MKCAAWFLDNWPDATPTMCVELSRHIAGVTTDEFYAAGRAVQADERFATGARAAIISKLQASAEAAKRRNEKYLADQRQVGTDAAKKRLADSEIIASATRDEIEDAIDLLTLFTLDNRSVETGAMLPPAAVKMQGFCPDNEHKGKGDFRVTHSELRRHFAGLKTDVNPGMALFAAAVTRLRQQARKAGAA